MMNFIKNKSIGYFMTAGLALLAIITAIFFIATSKGNMGNYATGVAPDTIGVFLIGGFVVELAVLAIPQYRFIHLFAVVLFGYAFYKETILLPDFIAGKINNVEYNGGNFGLNIAYFVLLFIIIVVSIVVAFLGFYKDEKVAKEEMSIKKNDVPKIARVGAAGVFALVAVIVSTLVAGSMISQSGGVNDPLLTPEIRAAAKKTPYKFNPKKVLIKERDAADYDWDEVKNLPTNGQRDDGANIVYRFEGAYAEGYQGDYSQSYAYLYLWDDGTFAGTARDTAIRGYWYNSSFENGTTKSGKDIKDCLNMVSNVSHYESIICEPSNGFYQYQAYMYLNMGWGTRSIIVNGYYYYPEVAMLIDTNGADTTAIVNEEFDMSMWTPKRVLKNLNYTAVFIPTEVNWKIEDEAGTIAVSYVDNDKGRGIASIIAKFNSTGTQVITATWGEFQASISVEVAEAEAEA